MSINLVSSQSLRSASEIDKSAGKAAPGSFDNVSIEVLSLHAVLKEGEETLFIRPLPTERAERLKVIKEGCDKVLVDLRSLVEKYESLGTQSKRTWDRMRWSSEDIAEIRARLTSNVSLLAAFISTSQTSVETKLDKFIEEFRQGKREPSVSSLQTVDSLSADDRAVWRTIRKELEEIGISVAAFEANRDFIFDWFVRAVETGAFEEHNGDVSVYISDSGSNESWSDEDHSGGGKERQIESTDFESHDSMKEHQPLIMQTSSRFAHDEEGSEEFDQISAWESFPRWTPETPIPRLASLLAGLSRPRQRLIKAVDKKEMTKALKILKDEASFRLLDLQTLNQALWMTSCHKEKDGSDLLIGELIAKGCDVNYISSDLHERTPLWNSVENGSFKIVQLLVDNGADVNYTGMERTPFYHRENQIASDFAPRVALKQDTTILRLLLSSGVNVNAQYKLLDPLIYRTYSGDRTTYSLIQEAAYLGATAAIEALLEYGAEIDALPPDGCTALEIAVYFGKEDVAQFLLAKGANPHLGAIKAAIVARRSSMIKLVLDRGVVPNDSTLKFAESVMKSSPRGEPGRSEDKEIMRSLEDYMPKFLNPPI